MATAKPARRSAPLTELDYHVLGVVWRDGPLTTYGVRARFKNSVTVTWSASTGSIYPAIRRLLAGGMLRASVQRDGRRTQDLRVTARGTRVLQEWLRAVPAGLAGPVADPIRSRVQFLGALAARDAAGFLAAAEADCRAALRRLTATESAERPTREAPRLWALRGASDELRSRLEWIRWVRAHAGATKERRKKR
jgi:DNA-binding PadR family transcriptional regulator